MVNKDITAKEVRVIGSDGKLIGIMDKYRAIDAAASEGLDLIEIAPNSKPPTCKIMNYGKYKYEQKKKSQEAKKRQTIITVKEIKLRPRTDTGDLQTKLKHARRFLEQGNKTKITIRFRGREMAHQEVGKEQLDKVMKSLEDISVLEVAPKMEGRQMFAMLAPNPGVLKELAKKKKSLS